jgi:hypothetical protein
MSDKVYPFHCGTQFIDWQNANCCLCSKMEEDPDKWPEKCELESALTYAAIDDGSVTPEIAKRLGWEAGKFAYQWRCGEFEPKEAADANRSQSLPM